MHLLKEQVLIRLAEPKDFEKLEKLEASAMRNLLQRDYTSEQMDFSSLSGTRKKFWDEVIFVAEKNYQIIGSASKLLNYFIKNYKPNRIISFSDKDWSNGDLYYKLGFKLINDLKPDYKFIIDGKRVNKQRLTKKKLVKLGKDSSLTGTEIIKEMGISKIYNVGQLKFELNF